MVGYFVFFCILQSPVSPGDCRLKATWCAKKPGVGTEHAGGGQAHCACRQGGDFLMGTPHHVVEQHALVVSPLFVCDL